MHCSHIVPTLFPHSSHCSLTVLPLFSHCSITVFSLFYYCSLIVLLLFSPCYHRYRRVSCTTCFGAGYCRRWWLGGETHKWLCIRNVGQKNELVCGCVAGPQPAFTGNITRWHDKDPTGAGSLFSLVAASLFSCSRFSLLLQPLLSSSTTAALFFYKRFSSLITASLFSSSRFSLLL